jgi:hypothetical protein
VRAVVLNCTLKPSPEPSNTEALARVVTDELSAKGVTVEYIRVVDHDVKPGVQTDMGGLDVLAPRPRPRPGLPRREGGPRVRTQDRPGDGREPLRGRLRPRREPDRPTQLNPGVCSHPGKVQE